MTNKNELVVQERNISDQVLNRINIMQTEGTLQIPENYSPENALKSAYLLLQNVVDKNKKPVLQSCTQESIANSLLEMIVQGLNPIKNQGYFIPYNDQLQFQRSYLGSMAITKRIPGVKDIKGYALYEDDIFETEFDLLTGSMKVVKYETKMENINPTKLKGAFAMIIGEDKILHTEVMTIDQIKKAWEMGKAGGTSKAHTNFNDQMAIKSVINRICKTYANTADDSGLIANQLNRASTDLEIEVTENANQEYLEFEDDIEAEIVVIEDRKVDGETGEILEYNPDEVKKAF